MFRTVWPLMLLAGALFAGWLGEFSPAAPRPADRPRIAPAAAMTSQPTTPSALGAAVFQPASNRAAPAAAGLPPSPAGPVKISLGIASSPGVFGDGGVPTLASVPPGRFRDALKRLSSSATDRALAALARLRVPLNDAASLLVDPDGNLFYACPSPVLADNRTPDSTVLAGSGGGTSRQKAADRPAKGPTVSINAPPALHSKPGATKVVYLDFNGLVVTGTRWNTTYGRASFDCVPYDTDGDRTTFSASEQADIREVWARVAEDYLPFDVDVTTEEPATFTTRTARALITRGTDAAGVPLPESASSAGVSFLDVFGAYNYAQSRPSFIYQDTLRTAGNIADTASHEIGHNLGLSHDGTAAEEYYSGHGEGLNSWAPIMGASYARNLSQWSRGEYPGANNHEDDIAIIAGKLAFRDDDVPDRFDQAVAVAGSGTLTGRGVVGKSSDGDLFRFVPTKPYVEIVATPFLKLAPTRGGNVHVAAELYDASGALVERSVIANAPFVYFGHVVTPGTVNYLRIIGTGSGDPAAAANPGYSSYGSEGQYDFVVTSSVDVPAPTKPSALRISKPSFRGKNVRLKFFFLADGARPTSYRVQIRKWLPRRRWQGWKALDRIPDTDEATGAQTVSLVAVQGAKYQVRVEARSRLGRAINATLVFTAPSRVAKANR